MPVLNSVNAQEVRRAVPQHYGLLKDKMRKQREVTIQPWPPVTRPPGGFPGHPPGRVKDVNQVGRVKDAMQARRRRAWVV